MAEKHNATCKICGKSYYACMSCADTMKLHPFKSFTDTAEHFKVFQIVRGFSTGVYTKDEAKEKFKNVDLSDVESFRPHIRDIVKDIIEEEITEQIVEIESVVNEEIEKVKNTEEGQIVSMVAPSRKKKFKVEVE